MMLRPTALRILFVSTSFPRDLRDWRGLFIRHLVEALSRSQRLVLSVWAPPGELPENVIDATTPDEARWLSNLMAEGGVAHLMRSGGFAALGAPMRLLRLLGGMYRRHPHVSLYHVNWLQCALPLPRDGKPALISVLGNDLKLLRLPFMKSLLRRAMKGRHVILCPNAAWMREPLEKAFGRLAQVEEVSFGIDPSWYAVRRQPDTSANRWIAVTRLTRDKLGSLLEWSEPLFRDGTRELHLFGPMQEKIELPDWIRYHGPATPEMLARDWFPTAQGLVTLSKHAEGRPQVMLEAMAAGLPIVASRMAAHADFVSHGRTGMLCGSQDEFRDAIVCLESPAANERIGSQAREWARESIGTWDDCAARYLALYDRMLAGPAYV